MNLESGANPGHSEPEELVISSAEFITSATRPEQYPREDLPEMAFAGRSNVGKSSLINCLVQRKKLVRTSRTPGRTQLINFFRINSAFMFVDLPGYGYAKVSQSQRATWGPMVETYIESRQNLRAVVQIMDLRHPPTPADVSLWNWLKDINVPAIPILTKADKLTRTNWKPLAQAAGRILGISPDEFIFFSAETRQGRSQLLLKVKEFMLR
ncbi:MAG: ribosome biogenesis GTP-binding protein YihA/YsxC [Syntrophobacteraceae bacterium]|nr:ribosome biogenesis GTP-binding protein YihA/YsxC [Syntrophobacteraceae bacterium]